MKSLFLRYDLLLDDFHDRVLDIVRQFGLIEPILEILLRCLEILPVRVGPWTQNLHQAKGRGKQWSGFMLGETE